MPPRAARVLSQKQIDEVNAKQIAAAKKRQNKRDDVYSTPTPNPANDTSRNLNALSPEIPDMPCFEEFRLNKEDTEHGELLKAQGGVGAAGGTAMPAELEMRLEKNRLDDVYRYWCTSMGEKEYRVHQESILLHLPTPCNGMKFVTDLGDDENKHIWNGMRKQVQLLNFECMQASDLAVMLMRRIVPNKSGDGLMLGGESFLRCPDTNEFKSSVVMLDVCDNCETVEFDRNDTKFLSCGECLCTRYCSKQCQKLHWEEHRVHCPVMDGHKRADIFKRTMFKYLMVLSANAAGTSTTCSPADGKQLNHPGNAVLAFMAKERPVMNMLVALIHDGSVQFMPLTRAQIIALFGPVPAEALAKAMTYSETIGLLVVHVLKRSKNVKFPPSEWKSTDASDPDFEAYFVNSRVKHGLKVSG